jgi:RNA polymerase sigma-70 factor (ECF subfamily)
LSELELIAKVKAGNHHAFTVIVNQHKTMVYSLALQMSKDPLVAEELAQDVFVKVYQKLNEFQGKSKLSTWIYKLTINWCYTKLRTKRNYENVSFADNLIEVDGTLNGLEQLEQDERVACLKLALNELDSIDAIILSLFYIEELSIEELVDATGFSKANVKVKLHRSRKKLLEIIQNKYKTLMP